MPGGLALPGVHRARICEADRLLGDTQELPDNTINDLRKIASRTNWLARQAGDNEIAILAELSRKCAEDAFVEGLRRGEPKKN